MRARHFTLSAAAVFAVVLLLLAAAMVVQLQLSAVLRVALDSIDDPVAQERDEAAPANAPSTHRGYEAAARVAAAPTCSSASYRRPRPPSSSRPGPSLFRAHLPPPDALRTTFLIGPRLIRAPGVDRRHPAQRTEWSGWKRMSEIVQSAIASPAASCPDVWSAPGCGAVTDRSGRAMSATRRSC